MSVLLHKEKFKKENFLLRQCSTNVKTKQKHKMFNVKTSSMLSRDRCLTDAHGEYKAESTEKPGKLPGNDTGTT